MKKVFDQTVRDLKREVNKKVLKVPGIEQKVLDSTSNEPWGPHGSLLADIAMATRNYHEYQMIMAVIWKRINDTGKNWRHVYKALTVLEYLVGHGSERVIDEIREHAYQIQTLSDFQYIDSSGRDQGSNVRKKSQSLVVLVNDKERIIEVRQKAAANRDKFRTASSTGGMYRPGSYGDRYEDDRYEGRYGSRDEDRNGYGYGKEREMGYRDDDRYGRYGDSNSRDGDRYGRDYDERSSRDGYRDDDYRGRSRSVDDYQYGSRSRSSDRDKDRAFDDDGQYSSRGSGARADDQSQEGRKLDRKFSEQNIGAPPSYEEAVSESRSPVHSERGGETPVASAPRDSSPVSNIPSQATTAPGASASPQNQEVEAFDEFDPRGSISAAPATSNNAEMDLLGSLSDSLAIVPTTSVTTASEADIHTNSAPSSTFVAAPSVANVVNQPFEDPFGDSPFKAIPSTDGVSSQQQTSASFQPTMNQSAEPLQPGVPKADTVSNFDFGDTFGGLTYSGPSVPTIQHQTNPQYLPQELSSPQENTDILADILPPSGPSPAFTSQPAPSPAFTSQPALSPAFTSQPAPSPAFTSQPAFSAPAGQPAQPTANVYGSFHPQQGPMAPQVQAGPTAQLNSGSFLPQGGSTAPITSHMPFQTPAGPTPQLNGGNFYPQQGGSAPPITSHMASQAPTGPAAQFNGGNFLALQGSAAPQATHATYQTTTGPAVQQNNDFLGNMLPQLGPNNHMNLQQNLPSSSGSLSTVPQPSKDKFETKSTVWTDTLSRGLVNLNISGPKINPLADIGIDFDAINRKEKRMEKPAATPVTSTINMGKAMGSGSGIGRAGASALRAPPTPMMGSGMGVGMGMGMNMGMGGGPGSGMGMGAYGGMNQQPMGMRMGMNMGMNMNMGMGQGVHMQAPTGLPPGSNMSGGYNPMMGTGGYVPQQPYGGGYR
ncbi:clathrin interactor EPSIN 2-like [Quercus lobata]|uniref:ENTH domain-containing protein n=1 Tax=Quercus lobata TaxID=97700 RepID=A0A7N2MRW4_QUELO|nr:clathrin interactor EPSIN 2-like [Quercus lobata]